MKRAVTHGRRVHRSLCVLLSCLLVGAMGGAVATARAASRPDILIFLTDDQRDAGSMIEMPTIRRVFGQGGTEFPNGFVTTPQCCPSRASIFSGEYQHNTGIVVNNGTTFNTKDTWERYLHDHGYFTGLVGKYLNFVPTPRAPYFDYAVALDDPDEAEQWQVARGVRAFFQRESTHPSRPWALVVATHSPHSPWTTKPAHPTAIPPFTPPFKPDSYQEADRTDKDPSVQRRSFSDAVFEDAYYGQQMETQAADGEFAQLWQTIRDHGEGGNLLAFFLSDNGFMWGDHGMWGKGEPYLENSAVPFYVRWPGHFAAGVEDRRIAANIDIAPTIYQAAGIKPGYAVDGHSLLGNYRRSWLLLELMNEGVAQIPAWYSYVAPGKRQYIEWSDGFVEDYNLRTDPAELGARNLVAPTVAAKLHAAETCSGAACP